MRRNTITVMGVRYIVLTFFVIFTAFPFYFMLISSFKSDVDLYNRSFNPLVFNYSEIAESRGLTQSPTLEHYEYLFAQTDYVRFITNSLIIGVAVVIITLLFAVPASYSLARLAGNWGERLGIMMFLVYLVPPTLLFIPMSRVIAILGLRNSILSLIVVYPTFTIPFCTWLLMGFMKSIPADLEAQAMVDGYTRLEAIWRVMIPLALPGILTVVVFAFTLTTHEYIYALAFISSNSQKVISTGITSTLILGDVLFWQRIMAAGIMVAVPVSIVYNFFLDRFVQGFTLGAVKG
jgi:multiple sugar transport system permease protein